MATNYKATDVANLTPEQIAYLQSLYAPASNSGYQAPLDPSASFGGQEIAPMWTMTTGSGEESGRTQYGPATGYQLAVEPGQWDIGDWRHNFDAQGNYQNTGQRDNDAVTDAMKGLAIMAPAFAATMFPSLGAAMSFGANPVLSGASATGATQAAGALGSLTGAASSAASPTLSKAALDGTNPARLISALCLPPLQGWSLPPPWMPLRNPLDIPPRLRPRRYWIRQQTR
jgi:hypothetical protein